LAPPRRQATRGRTRRRVRKNIAIGQAHIKTSFNNTIVSLTDGEGNVIAWESAGSAGFKGSRKSTPFAAQVTADAAARKGIEQGLQNVEGFVKGPGSGRETAIRSLQAAGLEILGVKDVTPQAHNGCRPRKRESEYGVQLRERKRARRYYGVLEKQFRTYYDRASRQPGITGENLLRILETRFDNVLVRLGFAASRRQARQ